MFSLLFSCGTIYGTIIIFWRLCKASHAHRVFLLHCCCCCVDEMYPCQVQTKHSRNWLIRKNQRNERIRDGIEWFVINMQAAPVSGDWTPITPNSIQLSFFFICAFNCCYWYFSIHIQLAKFIRLCAYKRLQNHGRITTDHMYTATLAHLHLKLLLYSDWLWM